MIMKPGQKLEYIGKGFLGFNPDYTEMRFGTEDGDHDLIVTYKSDRVNIPDLLVRRSEVVLIENK